MISKDLSNLADRIAGHATHGIAPTAAECGHIAAELLKLSHIVAQMEGLPFDVGPEVNQRAHDFGMKYKRQDGT